MKSAGFEFKCRRCGVTDRNPHTGESNAHQILISISLGQEPPPMMGGSVKAQSVHACADGGHGLSDLIGYSIVDYWRGKE